MNKGLKICLSAMLVLSLSACGGDGGKSDTNGIEKDEQVVALKTSFPENAEVSKDAMKVCSDAIDKVYASTYYKITSTGDKYYEYYRDDSNQLYWNIEVNRYGMDIWKRNNDQVDECFVMTNGGNLDDHTAGDVTSSSPMKIVDNDNEVAGLINYDATASHIATIKSSILDDKSDSRIIDQFQMQEVGDYQVAYIKVHTNYNSEFLENTSYGFIVVLKDGYVVQTQYYYVEDDEFKLGNVDNYQDFNIKTVDDFNLDEEIKKYSSYEGLTFAEMMKKIKAEQ